MLLVVAVLLFIAWKCFWASLLLAIYPSNLTNQFYDSRGITFNNLSAAILSWIWWTGAWWTYWSLCGLYAFITRIIGMCGLSMVYILCKTPASKAPQKAFLWGLGHKAFAQHINCKPHIAYIRKIWLVWLQPYLTKRIQVTNSLCCLTLQRQFVCRNHHHYCSCCKPHLNVTVIVSIDVVENRR